MQKKAILANQSTIKTCVDIFFAEKPKLKGYLNRGGAQKFRKTKITLEKNV